MLFAMSRCGMSPTLWITYPIPRRSSTGSTRLVSRPSTRMRPDVGSISRLIMRMVVVLPQPEGPTSTMVSPSATSKDRSPTASAEALPNRLPTFCKEIIEVSGTAALRGMVAGG